MENDVTKATMIMTTVKDRTDAAELAGHLISSKLAACVQELSIHSHFFWEGKTNSDPEILLLVKTASDRVDEAVAEIKKKHKYKVPEILVAPLTGGLGDYLQWVHDETRPREQ